jgi:hypothetical protein
MSLLTDIQKEVGQRLYAEGKIMDPVGCVDSNGKPIFDASAHMQYNVTEKEMSDADKLAWRTYQLYKLTMKVERRDSVYQALVGSDYTNGQPTHHFLGAPYPVIEPNPYIGELLTGVRWYEHIFSAVSAIGYYQYIRTKPNIKYSYTSLHVQKWTFMFLYVFFEMCCMQRSLLRLQGRIPNEPECHKFGVLESKERLEKKVEYWRKYKAYKEEWMRRWDYHVWHMRPGERYQLWSSCHFPPYPVLFSSKTDFPMRKNPFVLSSKPIGELRLDCQAAHYYPKGATTPVEAERPEIKYLWRGGIAT